MTYTSKHSIKKHYFQPTIETTKLDNQISLALESNPPIYESEDRLNNSELNFWQPFKNNNS